MTNESERRDACPWCNTTEHLSLQAVGSLTGDMPARPYRVICTHIDHDTVVGPTAYGKATATAAWNRRTYPKPCDLHETYARGCSHCHDVNGFMPFCARCDNEAAPPTPSREALFTPEEQQFLQGKVDADFLTYAGHHAVDMLRPSEIERMNWLKALSKKVTALSTIQSREGALRGAIEAYDARLRLEMWNAMRANGCPQDDALRAIEKEIAGIRSPLTAGGAK